MHGFGADIYYKIIFVVEETISNAFILHTISQYFAPRAMKTHFQLHIFVGFEYARILCLIAQSPGRRARERCMPYLSSLLKNSRCSYILGTRDAESHWVLLLSLFFVFPSRPVHGRPITFIV